MGRDVYDDSLSLRQARDRYFVANRFGIDGGYGATWVRVKVGPVPMWILNTRSRVRAVPSTTAPVLTGYRSRLWEANRQWEVATGCADRSRRYSTWA